MTDFLDAPETRSWLVDSWDAFELPESIDEAYKDRCPILHRVGEGSEHRAAHEFCVQALRNVWDPEIAVNIYDLGLIYGLDTSDLEHVRLTMTLTSPNCPEADSLPERARNAVLSAPGVEDATVDLVWSPLWGPERMSEATRLEIGFMS